MAVFRVQKTQNYTIMSNHHLRKALSAQGEGLLSLMLSLPEDWDYTTRAGIHLQRGRGQCVCHRARVRSGGVYYPPPHPRQERSDARYGVR